jgi:hypothetical protein
MGFAMHRRNFLGSAMNGLGALAVTACGGGGAGAAMSEAAPDGAANAPGAPGTSGSTPSPTSSVGIAPAGPLPAWVPAAGTAQAVQTSNTFLSQNGNVQGWEYAFGKIVDDYSGGVYNPYWGALGAMVFHGGGHSATFDNSVVILDYNDMTFKRLSNPTQPAGGANWSFVNVDPSFNKAYCEYGDGQPASGHTYDTLAILPPVDGGTRGSLVRVGAHGAHPGVSTGTTHAHRFDFAAATNGPGTWTRLSVNALKGLPSGACSAYDSIRKRFWTIGGLSSQPSFMRYLDMASRENRDVAYDKGAALAPPASPDSMTLRYDPVSDILVLSCTAIGVFRLAFLRCASPEKGWFSAVLSSNIPSTPDWTHPFDYVPEAKKFVMLSPADSIAVFDITIPADPAQTWRVTRQPLQSGAVIKSAYVCGKRWSYSQATRSFVWMATSKSTLFAYRPVGV